MNESAPPSPSSSRPASFSFNFTKFFAFLILLLLLAITASAWRYTSSAVLLQSERQFERQTEAITTLLDKRINACKDMLLSLEGLFAASKSVERDEFKAYLESSDTFKRYPEISSFRYIARVPREDVKAHLEAMRNDKSIKPEGYPNTKLHPADDHPEYYLITYFEPFSETAEDMLGANVWVDPVRREAHEKARDFGKATASGRLTPLKKFAGIPLSDFLITIPIYRNGAPQTTMAQRREALVGFITAPFSIKRLMNETLHRYHAEFGFNIDLEIFDGIRPDKDRLLYDSDTILDTKDLIGGPFERRRVLEIGGRSWLLNFKALKPIPRSLLFWLPGAVLTVGVIISFLIFAVLYNLSASQAHAEKLARQMTKHLRESEERFRQLAENIDEVFWLSDPGTQEMFYISKAYEKIWGRPVQSIYFKPLSFFEAVHPDDQKKLMEALEHQKKQGAYELEYRVIRPDGTIRWVRDRAFPIRDAAGKVFRVAGVADDITEKKKAEETILKTHERMEILGRATKDVIWDWHLETKKVLWNKNFEQIFKYHAISDETDIQFWQDNLHPEDRQRIVTDIEQFFNTQETYWSGEYRFRCGDGSYVLIHSRGTVIRGARGKAVRMIGSMEDITERRKLESLLLQAQKMETVGTLAGGIAHDLNNQLTPVRGYVDMVLREIGESHPAYAMLKEANVSAARCAEIIQRLLNFSRPSSHQRKLFSMAALFKEIHDLLGKALPATIRVEAQCPNDIWTLEGNDTEIQTVLMNLAANGRDAMPEGGTLTLTCQNLIMDSQKIKAGFETGHYILISVKDTGDGIPAENIPRIFDPFFSTKEKGRGTGLGLAMVFKIVNDHKGWIEVSSVLKKGTIFQVYLPAKPDTAALPASQQDDPLQQVLGNGETILFADDEEPIRNLGKIFLEKLNYKSLFAVDGENALEVYKKSGAAIQAVLMDMTMPKMTGKQALQKILEINPKARIIIMSGFTSEGMPEELLKFGAAGFLQKPYTLFSLGEALKKAL